jgi:hypothetical protein
MAAPKGVYATGNMNSIGRYPTLTCFDFLPAQQLLNVIHMRAGLEYSRPPELPRQWTGSPPSRSNQSVAPLIRSVQHILRPSRIPYYHVS